CPWRPFCPRLPLCPASSSRPLKIPRPLPAGHHLVELPLLGAEEMKIVLGHILAEGSTGELAALQLLDRLAQGGRDARQLLGRVEIPLKDLRRLDPLGDAVQAC